MIFLKKITDESFALNPDLIQTIEETPDTMILLVTGNRFIVRDSMAEVVDKVIEYRRKCNTAKKNNEDFRPAEE